MSTTIANLTTPLPTSAPKPTVGVSTDRRAPERLEGNRLADRRSENPKSNSPKSTKETHSDRPENPTSVRRDNSDATHPAGGKKAPKRKKGGRNAGAVDLAAVSVGAENQIDLQSKNVAAGSIFATILQAANQTKNPVLPGSAKTGVAGNTAVKGQGFVLGEAGGRPGTLNGISSDLTAGSPPNGLLKNALQGKEGPVNGVAGQQGASATLAIDENKAPVSNTIITTGLADQIANQSHSKPVGANLAKGSDILAESSTPLTQGVVSAVDNIGRWVRPVGGRGSRDKVTLRAKRSSMGKVTASASGDIANKPMGALLNGHGRQVRFDISGSGESGRRDSVISAQTVPADTAVTEAVARSESSSSPSPVNQIAEAFRSSSARQGQEIVIRLDPPDLGRVSVKLRVQGGEVRGVLEVDNPQTLSQLQREAPSLLARLTEAGVEMKRMDLSLSDNASSRESMRDGAWFAQQYNENETGYGSMSSGSDDVISGRSDGGSEFSPALATIGDDSINVWI